MRSMQWLGAGVVMLLVPCAAHAQQPNIRVQVPGVVSPVLLDSVALASAISAPVDRVLKVIDEVYAEWGLPAESFDAQVGRYPNRRVNLRRQFRGKQMSLYIDCGRGFSGNNADSYRITIATAAWPEPATGTATKLHVAFIGGGVNVAASGDGYVVCTTRGRFEEEFAKRVSEKLAASP